MRPTTTLDKLVGTLQYIDPAQENMHGQHARANTQISNRTQVSEHAATLMQSPKGRSVLNLPGLPDTNACFEWKISPAKYWLQKPE